MSTTNPVRPLCLGSVGVGAADDLADVRQLGARRPDLLAGHDPLVAVAHRPGLERRPGRLPAPGSLKSWHATMSPRHSGGGRASFTSSVAWARIVGRHHAEPDAVGGHRGVVEAGLESRRAAGSRGQPPAAVLDRARRSSRTRRRSRSGPGPGRPSSASSSSGCARGAATPRPSPRPRRTSPVGRRSAWASRKARTSSSNCSVVAMIGRRGRRRVASGRQRGVAHGGFPFASAPVPFGSWSA